MKFNIQIEHPEAEGKLGDPGFIVEVKHPRELHDHIDFQEEFHRDDEETPLPVHTKLVIERVE